MSFDLAHRDDSTSGNWRLVRRTPGLRSIDEHERLEGYRTEAWRLRRLLAGGSEGRYATFSGGRARPREAEIGVT
jgi:hypothetical protein